MSVCNKTLKSRIRHPMPPVKGNLPPLLRFCFIGSVCCPGTGNSGGGGVGGQGPSFSMGKQRSRESKKPFLCGFYMRGFSEIKKVLSSRWYPRLKNNYSFSYYEDP